MLRRSSSPTEPIVTSDPSRAQGLVADVTWFLDDIDLTRGAWQFARATRQSLSAASFLDARWTGRGELAELAMADVAAVAVPDTHPRFIWHTAFCCSTLLARALDVAGVNLSLKEPAALMTLSNAKRMRHPFARGSAQWGRRVGAAISLLGRQIANERSVVIKPSNLCNNLLTDMLAASGQSKALLLYSNVRSFLVSVIKKREAGRNFARRLMTAFAMDSDFIAAIPPDKLLQMTDLQVAAIAWMMQMSVFRDAVARYPAERVIMLDAEVLLAEPARVLSRVVAFLDLGISEAAIAEIVAGPIFQRNSKDDSQAFDAAERASEAVDVEAAFGPDLDLVLGWAAKIWPQLVPARACREGSGRKAPARSGPGVARPVEPEPPASREIN
jgi:hypothetical protein